MRQSTTRSRRVAELIQQELGQLIRSELQDLRFQWVSISRVEIPTDLKSARVYFSCMPGTEADRDRETIRTNLEKASGFLRGQLGRRLDLRYIPQLQFIYDDSLEHGDRINQLLRSLTEKSDGEH